MTENTKYLSLTSLFSPKQLSFPKKDLTSDLSRAYFEAGFFYDNSDLQVTINFEEVLCVLRIIQSLNLLGICLL